MSTIVGNLENLRRGVRSLSIVGALLLLVGLGGCAGGPKAESTGEYIDDTVLTTKVKAALTDSLGADGLIDIQVETFKGTVQLSGFVDSASVRTRAAVAAAGVRGVRQVDNRLSVK